MDADPIGMTHLLVDDPSQQVVPNPIPLYVWRGQEANEVAILEKLNRDPNGRRVDMTGEKLDRGGQTYWAPGDGEHCQHLPLPGVQQVDALGQDIGEGVAVALAVVLRWWVARTPATSHPRSCGTEKERVASRLLVDPRREPRWGTTSTGLPPGVLDESRRGDL